ncbi:MAG TPA: ABC transporter substrate-binding protein [Candidatus Acetothermia bacterium]|nr:ABC transporter substrate-binding protein [Candidatus Acetothermia bacterium]
MKRVLVLVMLGLLVFSGLALAQAKPVQITFWHAFGGARQQWVARRVADFNYTHPGIQVSVQFKGSYRDTLNAAILAAQQGDAPNVVQIFEIGTQLALDSGIFMPIQDLVIGPEFQPDDYISALTDYYKINGKFNSIPWNSSNPVLFYNKDIFRKAGLDPNKPPRTFEEMLADSKQIVESGAAKNAITWPLHSWFFEQWMANMGENLVNNGNGRDARATESLLTGDGAKTILTWWKEMADKGYWTYSGRVEDWDGSDAIFISGQAAMEITSTSDVTQRQNDAAANGFELGTSYLPYPAITVGGRKLTGPEGVIVGGASLWITKDHPTAQLQAAKTFVLWFTNTENSIAWHKATGYFPIHKSAIDVLKVQNWFVLNPAYKAAFDQLLNTKPSRATQGALIGDFPQVRTIIEQAIEKVIAGKATVDAALTEAKALADKAIQEYNQSVE